MGRGRAYRRWQAELALERARRLGRWWGFDAAGAWRLAPRWDFERWARLMSSTGCKPCSCFLCSGHRWTPPRSERIAALAEQEWRSDL